MSSKAAFNMPPEELKRYHPYAGRNQRPVTGQVTSEARKVAEQIAEVLYKKFGADKVMLYGSLARGDFTVWSDIDIAVWGIPVADFYRAVAFATGVSDKWKIDVVDGEDCPGNLQASILEEGIVL